VDSGREAALHILVRFPSEIQPFTTGCELEKSSTRIKIVNAFASDAANSQTNQGEIRL